MTDIRSNPVTDNAARRRFELIENGQTAFADYRRVHTETGPLVIIAHVETPVTLRGGGVAARLMAGVAQHARAEGFKIAPRCSYAAAWFKRNPAQADLLA